VTNAAIGQFVSDVNTSRNSVNQQINDVKEDKLAQNARYAASVGKGGGLPNGSGGSSGGSGSSGGGSSGNAGSGGVGKGASGISKDKCQCDSCETPASCRCGETTNWGITSWFVDRFFEKDECKGIWQTSTSAWQRATGYNFFYDLFFEVAEILTVFLPYRVSQQLFVSIFNADGGYWRIEAWKGNYLNMGVGAEMGIYWNWNPLVAVTYIVTNEDDWPSMQFSLSHNGLLFSQGPQKHWWLTGFRPGLGVIAPKELSFSGYIVFNSTNLATGFATENHLVRHQGDPVLTPSGERGVRISWLGRGY
jgi:hypothetical protein